MSRTAQVKKDARVGEAEARRDATIRVCSHSHCSCYCCVDVHVLSCILYMYVTVIYPERKLGMAYV